MINLFRSKNKVREKDAVRIFKIYENVDIQKRIKYIVESEYKRMIYTAERIALNGQTSFVFDVDIEEKDKPYFNVILSEFITKITENEFRYSRNMVNAQNSLTIYFSKIDIE